jgi:hypothetical protein
MGAMGFGWFPDLVLVPGEGALMYTRQSFLNTIVGKVLAPDGSPLDNKFAERQLGAGSSLCLRLLR